MAKRPSSKRTKTSGQKSPSDKPAGAKKRAREGSSPSSRKRGPAAGATETSPPSALGAPAAAPAPEKNKGGRPTACTPEILEEILDRIAGGEYLEEICRDEHMPDRRSVQRHKRRDDKFRRAYACAREDQMEALEFEAMSVAKDGSNDWKECEDKDGNKRTLFDHEHVQRSKLIVEQLRWTMTKLHPTVYGERMALDVSDATPLSSVLNKAKARARANGFTVMEAGDGSPETAH